MSIPAYPDDHEALVPATAFAPELPDPQELDADHRELCDYLGQRPSWTARHRDRDTGGPLGWRRAREAHPGEVVWVCAPQGSDGQCLCGNALVLATVRWEPASGWTVAEPHWPGQESRERTFSTVALMMPWVVNVERIAVGAVHRIDSAVAAYRAGTW